MVYWIRHMRGCAILRLNHWAIFWQMQASMSGLEITEETVTGATTPLLTLMMVGTILLDKNYLYLGYVIIILCRNLYLLRNE